MILPKLISIDTSIFGDMAKDCFSRNKNRSDKACHVISYLNEEGYIPFLSFHHVQEILQHQDANVVFERWSLIKKFPAVAWLGGFNGENILGSLFDIHQLEIKLLLENQKNGLNWLIEEVRGKHIKYMSGEDFVTQFESLYCELRAIGGIDVQRSKQIESLSHVRNKQVDNSRLSDLFKSRLKKPSDVKEFMIRLQVQIAQSLELNGDGKLLDPQNVAMNFVQDVLKEGQQLYLTDLPLYEAFIQNCGIRLDQVTPKTTVGQLGYIGIYNKKVRQILESLGVPDEREVDLSPKMQASWVIWEHLDKAMRKEKQAHGSNMQDKYMGVLALFVDIFTVDRRVHEYFIQLSRKEPVLSSHLGRIIKLGSYSELLRI